MITSQTKIVGVIGYPLSHSLSPLIHNIAFKKLNLNFVYLPFEIKPSQLKEAVKAIRALNLVGINVTIPYKEEVMKYIDEVEEGARLIGAINTIHQKEGRLWGYNTDSKGFLKSLKEDLHFNPQNKNILILGAGGAARAILVGLALSRAKKIILTNRTFSRAQNLRKEFQKNFPGVEIKTLPLEKLTNGQELKDFHLFVNSTPLGMKGLDPIPLPLTLFPPYCIIYDIVYKPPKTRLLREAEKMGLPIQNGLNMLVYQGGISFEIWTKRKPPLKLMKETLAKHLI